MPAAAPATTDPTNPPITVPTPGNKAEPIAAPPSHPPVPPATVAPVLVRFLNNCLPEILPLNIFAMSNEDSTTTVTPAVIALPLNSFAALFIAAAPYMLLPLLNAFTKTADALGPITATIASELPTNALLSPAFES